MNDLEKMFSPRAIRRLAKSMRPFVANSLPKSGLLSDAYDRAFCEMRKEGTRGEYVYRAAITSMALKKGDVILNEFRAGKSRVDMLSLNGTSVAYEIKSDLDSLTRIDTQIKDYRRVFASVNVVASDKHMSNLIKTLPEDVGVLRLTKASEIDAAREAKISPERTSPIAVFESLRLAEAMDVLETLGLDAPDMPNTQRFQALKTLFAQLDPREVHDAAVATLKASRPMGPIMPFISKLPECLHALALLAPVKKSQQRNVIEALNAPIASIE